MRNIHTYLTEHKTINTTSYRTPLSTPNSKRAL